jgi:hypothetical protein
MADLITQAYAEQQLAGLGLSAAQLTSLPAAITAASEAIERHCRRRFARADYDLVEEVGWDGTVLLGQYPVNGVSRIATGRRGALTVVNADDSTNQRATVAFSYSGSADLETGLTPTGITLSRVASGATSSSTLLFATYPTLQALAAAVVAVGSGWTASVESGYALWASADLVGGEAAQGALGAGARLDVFGDDLSAGDFELDRGAGVLRLKSRAQREDYYFDGQPAGRGGWGECRVAYNAGYQTIPAGLQDACVEAMKATLVGLALDPSVSAESAGQYSYSYDFRDKGVRLPESVLRMISPYRDLRA